MELMAVFCHIWGWEVELFRGNRGRKEGNLAVFGQKWVVFAGGRSRASAMHLAEILILLSVLFCIAFQGKP
jgi:hypothetical protein